MTTRKSWEHDPKFAYLESNPDPNFRPRLSALIDKLKHHKLLQNNPVSVEFLLNSLEWWFFLHEKERPQELFRRVDLAYARWRLALGAVGHEDEVVRMQESVQNSPTGDAVSKRQDSFDTEGIARFRVLDPVRRDDVVEVKMDKLGLHFKVKSLPGRFIWHGESLKDDVPTVEQVQQSLSPYLIEAWKAPQGTEGEAPEIGEEVRGRIQATVFRHYIVKTGKEIECGCGKKFPGTRKWSKHVMKRLVKTIESSRVVQEASEEVSEPPAPQGNSKKAKRKKSK